VCPWRHLHRVGQFPKRNPISTTVAGFEEEAHARISRIRYRARGWNADKLLPAGRVIWYVLRTKLFWRKRSEFKEAYRLKQDASFLYNIAQHLHQLGRVDSGCGHQRGGVGRHKLRGGLAGESRQG
jgi:hypothetical protein